MRPAHGRSTDTSNTWNNGTVAWALSDPGMPGTATLEQPHIQPEEYWQQAISHQT
jgi:hypothetical protein